MPDDNHDNVLPLGGENGTTPDLRMNYLGVAYRPARLTDGMMAEMLGDACIFLSQLVAMTSGVLGTLRVGDVRKVVAAEMPVAAHHIKVDGTYSDKVQEPEPAKGDPSTGSGRDHRKKPRGRTHPLMQLIKFGLQAARLLRQIGSGTHPRAVNKLSQADKLAREARKTELAFANVVNHLKEDNPYDAESEYSL